MQIAASKLNKDIFLTADDLNQMQLVKKCINNPTLVFAVNIDVVVTTW